MATAILQSPSSNTGTGSTTLPPEVSVITILLSSALALAGARPAATDQWVLVDDTAQLCARPDGQGQCARFRAPGADPVAGDGPRVFRVVSSSGDQFQLQAQLSRERRDCGVLPTRITPLLLRVYVPAGAVTELAPDDPCLDPQALAEPAWGRDWDQVDQRLAVVAGGTPVLWLDGAQAGQLRAELWLWEEHGPTRQGDRVCATFDLGPDDGGPVTQRAFDLCFPASAVRWDP